MKILLGRSLVSSTGEKRFEVEGEYGEKDGYSVAKVKWIEYDAEPQERIADLANSLREAIQQVNPRHAFAHDPIPTDPEALVYWVLREHLFGRRMGDHECYTVAFSVDTRRSLVNQLRYLLSVGDRVSLIYGKSNSF